MTVDQPDPAATPAGSVSGEPGMDPMIRATFGALARGFLAATSAVQGAGVRSGQRGPIVYGATTLPVGGLNRVMTGAADRLPEITEVDAVLAEMSVSPVMTWWIPPGPMAGDIERLIADLGFAADADDASAPAMWLALHGLTAPDLAPGVAIERASSVAAVREATLVAAEGFGMPPALGDGLADLFAPVGDQPANAARIFVARIDERPVASAVAVTDGDIVVIYNVATLPDARGRGIGGALTLAALLDARSRGAALGVLESSEMGLSVYRRLGFRVAGDFRVLSRSSAA